MTGGLSKGYVLGNDWFTKEYSGTFREAVGVLGGKVTARASSCYVWLHVGMTLEILGKAFGYVFSLRHYADVTWYVFLYCVEQ